MSGPQDPEEPSMTSDRTPADVIAVGVCRRCNQSGELVNHGAVCRPCADGEGWVRRTFTVWLDERAYGSSPDDDEIAYVLRMGGLDAETMQEHGDVAAGFRVTPEPDDNTRALAARLRTDADRYEDTARKMGPLGWGWQRQADDLLTAAAYLDVQPQDRPDRCPNPECDEGVIRPSGNCGFDDDGAMLEVPCSDPSHVGGSGDTR